ARGPARARTRPRREQQLLLGAGGQPARVARAGTLGAGRRPPAGGGAARPLRRLNADLAADCLHRAPHDPDGGGGGRIAAGRRDELVEGEADRPAREPEGGPASLLVAAVAQLTEVSLIGGRDGLWLFG